jgi:phage tail-like protein
MVSNNVYPVGFYFELSFAGDDAAFQEVSGITREVAVEEVACGGENRFKYRLPTGSTSQNLVLKRAIVPSGSALIKWCSACIDDGFTNVIKPQDVTVSLLDANGKVCVKWTFKKSYPVKYSVSDLKSQDNSLLIESIELAYTYFDVINQTS